MSDCSTRAWQVPGFYRFPAVVAIDREMPDKVAHLCEEAEEIRCAYSEYCASPTSETEAHIIEEAMDTIHAAETVLREFPIERIRSMAFIVREKNRARGYYGEVDDE